MCIRDRIINFDRIQFKENSLFLLPPFFRILASSGATNLLLVTFLIPVSAVLLGFLFLGEQLEPRHFAGMGLIALGLAAIDGRLLALRRPGVRTP